MKRYHPALVALHWLLAILVIGGLYMGSQVMSTTPNDAPEKLFYLFMHMTMGMFILALMVIRLVTRLFTKKPPHADIGNALLNKLGIATHWLLYALVFALGASGLAISAMAGLPDIVLGGSGAPLPETFDEFAPRAAHGILASLLMLVILGHFLAGLYHQYIRRDGLFGRMWFGKRN